MMKSAAPTSIPSTYELVPDATTLSHGHAFLGEGTMGSCDFHLFARTGEAGRKREILRLDAIISA